jgi:hypothetical protein
MEMPSRPNISQYVLHAVDWAKNTVWTSPRLTCPSQFFQAESTSRLGGGGVSVPTEHSTCMTGDHRSYEGTQWGQEFKRGVQPTLLGAIVPVGYSNYMTRGSVFIRGNSAYIIGGHCSCGVLTLHDLGCHWCKNEPRRNDDWSHQCKNDIYDVMWWLLLECHCTPNITPFQSCKCYCLDRGFSTYGSRTSTGTRTGNRWLMETVLQYCLLIILALVVRQG